MPDWAKAAVAASSNACFLSSLFGRATTFSSRRFKQTADLGTSDQVAATAERKIENRLDDFHRFPNNECVLTHNQVIS